MKLLTPAERDMLLRTNRPCEGGAHREANSGELTTLADLVEQGRVQIAVCPCHPDWRTYQITPEGREALTLWERIKQLFSREG